MKNFNLEVYEIVKKVPRGRVTTYGEVAQALGKPRWARQVGWVLHQNKQSLRSSDAKRPAGLKSSDVPCHRVVDRNGRLAPNFGGPSLVSFGRQAPSKPIRCRSGRSGAFSAKGGPTSGWDGWREQQRRLVAEGVSFLDEMHVDLKKCLW